MAAPSTAFAKALRSYETGGFTSEDLLSELDLVLASGASPGDLIEALRLREEIEPLPRALHDKIARILSDARARSEAAAATAADVVDPASPAVPATPAAPVAAAPKPSPPPPPPPPPSTPVVPPAPVERPPAVERRPAVETPAPPVAAPIAVIPPVPAQASPPAETPPLFPPVKISRRAIVDGPSVPAYSKETLPPQTSPAASAAPPAKISAPPPRTSPAATPIAPPPPVKPPLPPPAPVEPPPPILPPPILPPPIPPAQVAPAAELFDMMPVYDPTIPEEQLHLVADDAAPESQEPPPPNVPAVAKKPSRSGVAVQKLVSGVARAAAGTGATLADMGSLATSAAARAGGTALRGISESLRSGALRLADGTGMLVTSAADALRISRARAAERTAQKAAAAAAAATAAAEAAAIAATEAAASRQAEADRVVAAKIADDAAARAWTPEPEVEVEPDPVMHPAPRFAGFEDIDAVAEERSQGSTGVEPELGADLEPEHGYPRVPIFVDAIAAGDPSPPAYADAAVVEAAQDSNAYPDTMTMRRVVRPGVLFGRIGIGVAALCLLLAGIWWSRQRAAAPSVVAPTVAGASHASLPVPGSTIKDCPTCMVMSVMPAAQFKQGSLMSDSNSSSFEKPQHWVIIGRPLAMAVNPVTVDDFREFADATQRVMKGCDTYDGTWRHRAEDSWQSPGFKQTGSHPVTCVSWADAAAFAEWYSTKTGHHYRLPTASEWEYAARAGGDAIAHWGAKGANACAFANVADQSAAHRYPGFVAFPCSDGYVNTSPVGSFKPNAFGLDDMLGNVFQWTQDCWHPDYRGAPVDGSARTDGDCSERELRGGSWFTKPAFVRANYRNHFATDYRASSVGFRLVRDLTP